MDWTQFSIFFISVFGLFLWSRAEARSDIRYMDQKLESNRELVRAVHEDGKSMIHTFRETIIQEHRALRESMTQENTALRESMTQEMKALREVMAQESKDFHGRLCAIEERRLRMREN